MRFAMCNRMSRSPIKIHVTPNLVAPAPALTSTAMGPTKLVLAVVAAVVVAVVAAIVAAVYQRHVVPGEIPYGLNVHVGGTEPRVFDGRCSVSIGVVLRGGVGITEHFSEF